MDGFGNINWWGFSPCINLLEDLDTKIKDSDDELNVLIACAGDQRHILKTIACQANAKKKKKINFYIYEKMLELYARDFLLLSIALEHPSKRGLQEKTELFLEIFGNLFVRTYTAKHIQKRANEFIKFITDIDFLKASNLGVFDFEQLKFKERDFLEGIFKFWRLENSEEKPYFPADKCWDYRLRNYFKTRYDSRTNAYDWDLSMKLSDRKHGGIIHRKIYSQWRDTGIAFDLRDSTYDTANFTLASSTSLTDPRSGDKIGRRGYFGDIILGPYISYGIETKEEKFYGKQNQQYKHTATDISEDNMNIIMRSLLEVGGIDLKKYQVEEKPKAATASARITEIIEEEDENVEEVSTEKDEPDETNDYIKLDNYTFTFLPLTSMKDFGQKAKFDKFFDVVYVSNSCAGNVDKTFTKILKENALVIMETAKFMIEIDNEKIAGFTQRLRQIAVATDLHEIEIEEPKADKAKQNNETKGVKLETRNVLKFRNGSK